jgi:integrase
MEKLRQLISQWANSTDLLDVVDLLYETGMRRREAQGLKWSDVDLEKQLITIRPGKSAYERRFPVGANIVSLLRYRRKRVASSEFVFGNSACAILRRAGIQFSELTSRALGRRLGLHLLRHAFAHRWMHSGGDISSLAAVLGHSSVQTTLKVYVSRERQREQLRKVVAAFGG